MRVPVSQSLGFATVGHFHLMSQLDECPVCKASLPSNEKSREANEAHTAACISQRVSKLKTEEPPLPEQVA